MRPEVVACIPAKALPEAKSRLGLPDEQRRLVAKRLLYRATCAAMASDWVSLVLVVTADDSLADIAASAGARIVHETPTGLNVAVTTARQAAWFAAPDAWVLTLVADLPHVAPGDIDALIVEALTAGVPIAVPDQLGIGTTALLTPAGVDVPPLFGLNSSARHVAAGYRLAGLRLSRLREDLDEIEGVRRLPAPLRRQLLRPAD